MAGGMHGRGVCMAGGTWQWGACMTEVCVAGGMEGGMEGGVCGRGACIAGGHAWQEGHAWQGGVHGGGVCGRYYEIRSMSGRYASYWNAFLS